MILIVGRDGQLARALLATAPPGLAVTALGRDALDLAEPDQVAATIAALQPSLVINAAAYTAVDRAEDEWELAFLMNSEAPAAMARATRAEGGRFVTVSTDFVFDGRASTPYRIDAQVGPISAYGESKALGEAAVLAADPDALIVRTAWVYDMRGHNFVTTMLRLMRERDALPVVADQIGTPTAATTLARAIWTLAHAETRGLHHVTDAGVASWYDFAVAIQEIGLDQGLLDRAIPIRPIPTADFPTRARRPAFGVLDKSRAWALLPDPPRHWRTVLAEVLRAR